MKIKKVVLIVIIVVALLAGAGTAWLLLGRNREPEPEPPESYTLEGMTIPALTEEQMPEPLELEPAMKEEEPEEEVTEEEVTEEALGWRYEDLEAPVTCVEAYVDLLTGEDQAFQFVDDRLFRARPPESYEPAGELRLAREQEDQETSVMVKLAWDETSCAVTMETMEGRIKDEARRFSSMETITYLRSLHPSKLGLEGSSMEEYRIYTMVGGVLVDGRPCIPVNIYHIDPNTGTNELGGIFYLASDERRIYRKDLDTGELTELRPAAFLT